jgi:PTS system glucose-specific IIA component
MFGVFSKKKEKIYPPCLGRVIALSDVPDAVFSQKMVGDGVAIMPESNVICSPCEGRIVQIFPTGHAIGIETVLGFELLIHIGIDTVELKGEGFKRIASVGDCVKVGDPLVEVDLAYVESCGKSICTPIIITNMELVDVIERDSPSVLMTVTKK